MRLLLSAIVVCVLLYSCEDVININLKESAPRLVVEGIISNNSHLVTIQLHKSTDYFEPSEIVAVKNAKISLIDSHGSEYKFDNNLNGAYSKDNFYGVPGVLYTMKIDVDGEQYTASSRMPELVMIDSVNIYRSTENENGDQMRIFFNDPSGTANYYQLKIFKNGLLLIPENHYSLFSDKYFDGTSTSFTVSIKRYGISQLYVNDQIKVQLISIDRNMYDYYQVLRNITSAYGMMVFSTPSNPPGNITNGALGYFSAWSVSEKILIIKR
jgi:hypothetical protein